jgi:hypothetical protein
MKKLILSFSVLTAFSSIYGQTWGGSTSVSGDTYRSGNVGIGSFTTPTALLHVQSATGNQFKLERNSGLQSNVLSIGFTSNPTSGISVGGGSTIFTSSNPNGTSDMLFMNTPTTHALIIKSSGKVGVNTLNPTAGLTVNGNVLIGDPAVVSLPAGYKLYVETGILTEKVKVAIKNTSNWSDFVFEENYKMLSLNEVESYINTNNHLPGIPSAKEVVANGIDLAEMDARLLQKVEELTLYIIELEKKINAIKAK